MVQTILTRPGGQRVHDDDTVRRAALGSLLLGFAGSDVPPWLHDALQAGLGGVVLFGGNVADGSRVADLTARLRAVADRDLVVALDEEGGDVTRLDTVRGSASPGAAALGHLDDVATTEEVYAAIGARLAAAGVTVDLAPVADVNSDPRNPVIGVRSFGAEPELVARHVAAAVRGLQRSGVAACVKHFPGHGATAADSHHAVPTIGRTRAELETVELVPFRAGVGAGARAVMTGHLFVPALDERLATVSAAITTGLLRGDLGFGGTVLTDALEMRALSRSMSLADGVVAALAAGADAVETGSGEYPALVDDVPAAVLRAVSSGRLDAARVVDAAERTARLARPGSPVAFDGTMVASAAGRALEVVGRLPALRCPLLVECRTPNGEATGALPWALPLPRARRAAVDEDGVGAALARVRAHDGSVVLVVRDPHRLTWQVPLLDAVSGRPGAVVVDVGWPAPLSVDAPLIRTRGIAPVLLAAAARVLSQSSESE